MTRRPASITQADLRRAIEAAKKAGASAVEVRVGDSVITIRITSSSSESSSEQSQDIVL
jgi:hypothetical protein